MRKIPFLNEEIIEFTTLECSCVYLKDQRMQISYKFIRDCTQDTASELILRGWRRFGNYFSRPSCKACNECLSLRVDVDNFTLSKSDKRVLKKNSDTFLEIREPTISDEHLQLYDKYHKYMQEKKGWEFYPVNHEAYEDLYIKGSSTFGKEVAYYIDGKLVGVDLIDLLEDGISSIYFYYDPNFRNYSLGRYSIFKEIELAKEMNKRWVYLGYSVKDNSSLNYKLNYKPHQILSQRPKIDEEAKWHTK